jgi:predicted membrane channel-forming protein YqfA (hemolysin III family)
VTAGVWTNTTRWRTFADIVAFALGINVWISIVLLPGFFVGSWQSSGVLAIAALPLIALGFGMWRRSEAVLLLVYPSALMVPVAMAPEIVSSQVYGPIRFVVVSLGLVAYLLGVSFFSSFYEPPPPEHIRPLASSRQPVPPRWRRRFRMYRALMALSVVFPVVFLYTVNFDDTSTEFIRAMFPGRVTTTTTVINLTAVGFWVYLYSTMFLGVLRPHRTGDRKLVADLARIRAEARRGRPGFAFYVGVFTAVGFLFVWLLYM